MSEPHDWEAAAPEILAVALKSVEEATKKAADDLYERMLYSVQEYLSENVLLNIASTIEMHRGNMFRANERTQEVEAENRRLIIEARAQAVEQVRKEVAGGILERAQWLRSEWQKGGNYEHLSTREKEATFIAEQVLKGRYA